MPIRIRSPWIASFTLLELKEAHTQLEVDLNAGLNVPKLPPSEGLYYLAPIGRRLGGTPNTSLPSSSTG